MDVTILAAIIAAALIVAYLIWKRRTAPKKSVGDSAPATDVQEPAVEPSALREEEPAPAVAEASDDLSPEAMPSDDLPSEALPADDLPESALAEEMRPAALEAFLDKALKDADPAEAALEEDSPAAAGGIVPAEETADTAGTGPALTAQGEEEAGAPEPSREAAEQEPAAPAVADDRAMAPGSPEPDLPVIRFTVDAYTGRMNDLEGKKRAALTQAIADQDDNQRDRLQRELVVMNDRLTLIADSYTEDVARARQALRVLVRLREELGDRPALVAAIDNLCHGNTVPAEACLAAWSDLPPALAGSVAFCRGLLAECRVDLHQALALYRQAASAPDAAEPRSLYAAGRMARLLYDYQEAIACLESFVRQTRQTGGHDPLTLAFAQRELAYTYILAGQRQKAGPLYKEAMLTIAGELGQDHQEMAVCWFQIGELQETLGEYDKAVGLYKKALAITEQEKGAEHPALAPILAKLAALCVELEMESESVPLYERLVRIRETTLRPDHLQLAVSLNSLAESYRLVSRYQDAEACYLKILAINEAVHGPDHPSVAAVLQELAKLNTKLRRPEVAQQYQDRAAAIFTTGVEASKEKSGEEPLTLDL